MGDIGTQSPLRAAAVGGLVSVGMLLVVGGLSLAFGEPLLFPSLGPTIFMQMQTPPARTARVWNILIGHGVGVIAAAAALAVTGAMHTPPPIATSVISWQRELASALAVGFTIAGQVPLRAVHPPAAATTLLITLGAINPEWRAIAVIAVGVVMTAILGEAGQFFLAKAVPLQPVQPTQRHYGGGSGPA